MTGAKDLKALDGLKLSAEYRAALRPGEGVTAEDGTLHHLPRFFFEVPSWEEALRLQPLPEKVWFKGRLVAER